MEDSVLFKTIQEKDKVTEFLEGLNPEFDQQKVEFWGRSQSSP